MARALGYSNGRDAVRKHVEGEDKTTVAICDTGSSYKTQTTFINESDLYSPLCGQQTEVLNVTSSIIVDEGDGTKRPTPTTSGIQQMLFINEYGLYSPFV